MSASYILVVEDDRWQAEQHQRVLEAAGYEVQCCNTPQAAIELIDKRRPQVIILDLLLEANTAFILLHELQSDAKLHDVPVVVCSNLADSMSLDQLSPYGVRRIIDKTTMHPQDVVAAVKAMQ